VPGIYVSPLELPNIFALTYDIMISKDGYQDELVRLKIIPKIKTIKHIELKKKIELEQIRPKQTEYLEKYTCGTIVTDIDGKRYTTVNIGDQCWMINNLNVSRYRDGSPIAEAKTIQA